MMQINQFRVTFNHENIMDDFDIYESVNVNYKSYAKYFNQLKDEVKEALSIIYLHGKVYILIKKGKTFNSGELDIKRVMISNLGDSKEFIIFKLLAYAKSSIEDKEVLFDSDGLFYIVKSSTRVYETVLVNIKNERDNRIYFSLNAKNFIKKSDNEKYSEKRDKYRDDKGILVRLKKGETPKSYFVKQNKKDIKNGYKRSSVDFLQTDWTKRKGTKVYTLIRFLKDIRKNLKNYLTIDLEEIEFRNFELKGTSAKRNQDIKSLLMEKLSYENEGLIIEDFVKDNNSQKFIDEVETIIKEEYNSVITLKKIKTSKSQFNLFITESIDSENDPYDEIKRLNKLTQNILLKNLEGTKIILPVLLKELLIKQDILNGTVSIANYKNSERLTFYYFQKEKDTYKIYKMILDKGFINCKEVENRQSLFEEDEKGYIQKILFEASQNRSEAELIIKNDKGDVNIITKTNYFSIPNISHIVNEYETLSKPFYKSYSELLTFQDDVPIDRKSEYMEFLESITGKDRINLKVEVKKKKVKNYLSNKFNVNLDKNLNRSRKNNTVLDVLTGIKYSYINDKEAFFVTGTKDIASSFSRSNVIRKIEAIEGNLLLDELLVMMDEYFVKNKELTVLPYPLKYLREFSKMGRIKE